MLTVSNLEVSRTYINGDYRKYKFQTVAEVKIGDGYRPAVRVTLSDERTDKIVAFIIEQIRESLTVEIEKPEPIVEDYPQEHPHPALEVAGPL